jgi:hypothetical protein
MVRTDVAHVDETPAGQQPKERTCGTPDANSRRLGGPLPPTSPALAAPEAIPYVLWWTETSTAEFRRHLHDQDIERRAYWLGALLREANTRDVWLFTTPQTIRELWPHLVRHLGRSRAMWAYLLDIDDSEWPRRDNRSA